MKKRSVFLQSIIALVCVVLFFSCAVSPEENEDNSNDSSTVSLERMEDSLCNCKDFHLIWSDEFNCRFLDSKKWTPQTGDGSGYYPFQNNWGNNELEYYRAENISFDGRNIILTAKSGTFEGFDYTSARLYTKDNFTFTYGAIEVRAKLPYGQGIWPAVWMLGTNLIPLNWPKCGEVDIVEMTGGSGSSNRTVYGTAHWGRNASAHQETQGSFTLSRGKFSDNYHVFKIVKDHTSIKWYVDKYLYKTWVYTSEADGNALAAMQRGMYLIMNLSVGGIWPGYPNAETVFPQKMYVDYIRVYKNIRIPDPIPADYPTNAVEVPSLSNINAAIHTGFTLFDNGYISTYGAGQTPTDWYVTNNSVDGSAIAVTFPNAGGYGGIFYILSNNVDLSGFSKLVFAVKTTPNITDISVKLETTSRGPGKGAQVSLSSYSGTVIANGFKQYKIPLMDFYGGIPGFDLTNTTIPFQIWNPVYSDSSSGDGTVIFDDIYCE